jgi:hypothetical protein
MIQKVISIIITSLLFFSLWGCGGTSRPATENTAAPQTQQAQDVNTPPTVTPQPTVKPQPTQQTDAKTTPTTQVTSPAVTKSSAPAQVEKKDVTVYVTRTGAKYHRSGCRYLSKSKIPMSLSSAKAAGYGPCSVCNPPN